MNRYLAGVFSGLGLTFGMALAADAQPAADPAPAYPAVGFYAGRGPSDATRPMLRYAEPEGDPLTWFSPTDPAVAYLKANPRAFGSVYLTVDVGPDGRATGCAPRYPSGDTALTEGLCERISPRVRALPALDAQGVRTAGVLMVSVVLSHRPTPPENLVYLQPPSPAPPPHAAWPPWNPWTYGDFKHLDLFRGSPADAAALAEPWAGVEVSLNAQEKLVCRVVLSSKDAKFDKRACDAASSAAWDFARATQPYMRRISLHMVAQDGKPRALPPLREHNQPAAILPDSRAALDAAVAGWDKTMLAKVRLSLDVDATGAVTGCHIYTTSGSDPGDLAACNLARTARFTPAEDVFGRPTKGGLWSWKLAGA